MSNQWIQDIIPPHGFIHKPSLIWPISPTPGEDGRIKQTKSYPPPQPGHADTLQPDENRINESQLEQTPQSGSELKQKEMMPKGRNSKGKETHSSHDASPDSPDKSNTSSRHWRDNLQEEVNQVGKGKDSQLDGRSSSSWLPKPPKVLMEDPNATPLELRSQIQLYATNESVIILLCHIILFTDVVSGASRGRRCLHVRLHNHRVPHSAMNIIVQKMNEIHASKWPAARRQPLRSNRDPLLLRDWNGTYCAV